VVVNAKFDREDNGSISATAIERKLKPFNARTANQIKKEIKTY
jgi:hypothetical protein